MGITLDQLTNTIDKVMAKIKSNYVLRENGKGLSSNDYTIKDKDKVAKIDTIESNISELNSQIDDIEKRTSGYINLLEFGVVCDGIVDDTNAFQNAIDYCLETLGTEREINTIKIPTGRYKITKTITTYPQIKLIADGFVKIESYIENGSVFYLRYPEGKGSLLGCDYRGNPISGGSNGILIKNMLYTNGDKTGGDFGGDNIALELGTREEHDALFSDIRMVSRYNLDNILINGFKTGMQINGISHFMGHYEYVRIELCDTCVQVGEYQGQTLYTSIENFNFNSCLFERSNNVIKWIRNGVGLTFNNCSFDFILDNLMLATTSGQRRIIFNNGHIEKIRNYLFLGDYETTFKGINTLINFKGVEMHLKYGQLFKSGSKILINFDSGCTYVRDEYYNSNVNNYIAAGKKMGCENTYYNDINYTVFENDGVPTTGVNYITNGDFSMTDAGSLISTDVDYIKGFSSQKQTGAMNGTYSITDFSDNLDSWDISKQLNFQISPTSNYGNFSLVTNKIPVKSFRVSPKILVKSNDYNKTSLTIKVKCFDSADILIDKHESKSDHTQKWGTLPINEWCVFTPLTNTGIFLISEKTSYITIEFLLQSSNINSYFNITNLTCEFN